MKKTTFTANLICMSAILLGTLSVRGMENNEKLALQAEKYNAEGCPLTSLPPEQLIKIFSHCLAQDPDQVKSLEKSMKTFMRLSSTCKSFNQLLTFEEIGKLCENYGQNDKNKTLEKITSGIHFLNYKIRRLPALILAFTGAGANTKNAFGTLLAKAVDCDDEQMAAILFQHHANPNVKNCVNNPVLFNIKTIEMAKMFIANGVNIHATCHHKTTTVLYYILPCYYPSELLELYLKKKVDATKLHHWGNFCLLHDLARSTIFSIENIADFLKKAALLLNAMPKMVNLLDEYGKTPVDIAQESLEKAKCGTPEAFEKLIALYRAHGGLTAQELKQQATSLRQSKPENKQSDCIICLCTQEDMFAIPCSNGHSERMCIQCYNELLKTSDKCPLCRNALTK